MAEQEIMYERMHVSGSDLATLQFGKVITAMVTPMPCPDGDINNRGNGRPDLSSVVRLARYLEATGSEGLVIAGTTGESSTMTDDMQKRVIEVASQSVDIPILAGTGSNSTEEAVELTERVSEISGVDGMLVVSPYYNRPPQRGIKDYYKHVADAADGKPVIMYDIPARTGRAVETDTILELAREVDNIVGIKIASGPSGLTQMADIKKVHPDFLVYSGDDALNLRYFGGGADGAISVVSHWAAKPIKYMYELAQLPIMKDQGYLRKLDRMLNTSYEFASMHPNPIPAKAMMRYLFGAEVGYGKSPMLIELEEEKELDLVATEVYKDLKENFEAVVGEPLSDYLSSE